MKPAVRRNRPVRLEQLEGREVPALFVANAAQTFAALDNNGSVAAADFDGDGKTDVALSNYGHTDILTGQVVPGKVITLLRGLGDGTFSNMGSLTVGNDQKVSFVTAADLDADGDQDLVATSSGANEMGQLTVFLNNGTGGFTKPAGTGVPTDGKNTSWVAVGQMTTGDTDLDVVVTSFGSPTGGTVSGNNFALFQGDGKGGFALLDTFSNGFTFIPNGVAVGDWDGDGDGDVALTVPGVPASENDPQPEGSVYIYLGNGAGGLEPGNAFPSGGAVPYGLVAADLNADGKPDLVVVNPGDPDQKGGFAKFGQDSSVGVLMNTGGGNFSTNNYRTGLGQGGAKSVFAVAPADFDGDGKLDIAACVHGMAFSDTVKARLIVYKGDGNGGFAAAAGSPFASNTSQAQYIAAGTFDGNASPDVVMVGVVDQVVTFLNQTDVTPPAATSTALVTSGSPAVFGSGYTLTATVTPDSGAPTGTVTFLRNGTAVGTGTLALVGGVYQASYSPGTGIGVGTYDLTARYEGAQGFNGSTSGVVRQQVTAATPAVTLTVSSATPTTGDTVTLTATVSSPLGTPAGSVEFLDNGTVIATRTLAAGTATFSTAALSNGPHQITARYLGQGNFGEVTSDPKTVTVSPPGATGTTTTLASGSPSAVYGAGFTLTATVAGNGTAPTGSVTFKNGAAVLGTVNLTTVGALGVASLPVGGAVLNAGVTTLTAEYGGAAGFTASAGTTQQTITAATPTAGLTANPGVAAVGQPITLTATVSSPLGTPTGSVTFKDGAAVLATRPLVGGVAVFDVSTLAAGGHILTAQYLGEGNFAARTSNDAAVTVTAVENPPPKGDVSVTAANTPARSTAGQAVTLTATVTDVSGHAADPTGSVSFLAGALVLGTAPLVGGTATVTTTALPVGTSTITYVYPGDANFNGGGGTLSQTVTAAAVTPPVVTVPPVVQPALLGYREFAVGAGAGRESTAQFYNPDGTKRFEIANLFPGTAGGVRVTSADFNGDGVAEVVAGTGPGSASQVRVIDGVTQRNLFTTGPFEATFLGGVFISTGDLTGDGVPDLIVSPDEGGGPRVLVYDGRTFTVAANFFGIDDPAFRGGARTATGDIDGDGRADLVVAAGFGGGPRVSTYNGTSVGTGRPVNLFADMFLFEEALRNGVYLAVGDMDGDGHADLVGGGGPGGGPRVLGLSGKDLSAGVASPAELANFFAGNTDNRGGVRVAVKNLDGDGRADLVVGDGVGGGSRVTTYLGKALTTATMGFDAYPGFDGGVFVG